MSSIINSLLNTSNWQLGESKLSQVSKTNLNEAEDKKLKETCRDLEAVFLSQLIKAMRATVPKSGLLGNSFGQDVFQSMYDDEIAKAMAQQNSTGLAQMLYLQMKQNLSLANNN